MKKSDLHSILINKICETNKNKTIIIAIDGVDTSGKTTLANELQKLILCRPVVRLSIDGFHNPKEIRTNKGELSSEGYYYDSFNYDFLTKNVLEKIKSGASSIASKIFDYRTETAFNNDTVSILPNSVILFDGVFLLRKELLKYWDISIFLDISFETVIKRAEKRDIEYFGDKNTLHEKYNKRYIPGQKLYFQKENPRLKANIVIDYNDYDNPKITKNGFDF